MRIFIRLLKSAVSIKLLIAVFNGNVNENSHVQHTNTLRHSNLLIFCFRLELPKTIFSPLLCRFCSTTIEYFIYSVIFPYRDLHIVNS
jgi:hypothetical protein